MLEKSFPYTRSNAKLIEHLVNDENVVVNHVVLEEGDHLPRHFSDSNVYLVIVRGIITLKLGDEEGKAYGGPHIIHIPYHTEMSIGNKNNGILEFFIVKAPSPRHYHKKSKEVTK